VLHGAPRSAHRVENSEKTWRCVMALKLPYRTAVADSPTGERLKGRTVMIATPTHRNDPQLHWTSRELPTWTTRFSLRERQAMVKDDVQAARVAMILAGILTIGVVLAIVSVWVTM
jgi:hypothetical protein